MSVTINSDDLSTSLLDIFGDVLNPNSEIYKEVVTDVVAMLHERIHIDGKAANGEQIGTYSNAYMKVRTGNFSNSDRFKKGVKAGTAKNAGTHTKGDNTGKPRAKHNRTNDTKIIISLTRQLENDYGIFPTETGWGVGFHNSHNADKARWNDNRYGKTIYALSDAEIDYAAQRTSEITAEKYK